MAAHKALISSEKSCIGALRNYVDKMLDSVSEMKILLLDAETTGVISMVYTQTEILRRQTFLVEDLRSTAQHGRMMHLRAVVFVRPTAANVEQLTQELADPHYSEYYIFFSGIVNQDMLSRIAKADVHEVIRTVQEFYGDYYAITHDCFTLNIVNSLCLSLPKTRWRTAEDAAFERTWAGVVSILLAMKMKPVVRYQGSSDLARILARKVQKTIMDEGRLFSFRSSSGPPTLLLLDRRDDPVTPSSRSGRIRRWCMR